MKLLREAYFSNTNSSREIPRQNIALVSDMGLVAGILEAVMYQANANSGSKNTFLFR